MTRKVSSSIKLTYKVLLNNKKNFITKDLKHWNDYSFGNYITLATYKDYEIEKRNSDLYKIRLSPYFGLSFKNDTNECQIQTRKFGEPKSHYTYIDLNITTRDEFFNHMMCNDIGTLTFEDLEVLKQIKNLTLKIIKGNLNG